jgi:hypothetical protein
MSVVTRHVGSFIAKDAKGRQYRIHRFTDFIQFGNSKSSGESPGFSDLRTHDGNPVNYVSKGHYRLVFPEIDLTSDDPDAP